MPTDAGGMPARPAPLVLQELGAGPPLLLIHGGFANSRLTWGPVLPHLAPYRRLLLVDRRGHGASPVEPRPYTIASDAADVLAALGHRPQPFAVAGHSYGALVALELARQAPDRLTALHLLEPPYLALLPTAPEVRPLLEEGGRLFRRARAEAERGSNPEKGAAALAEGFFRLLLGPEGAARLQASSAWPTLVQEAARSAWEQFAGTYPPEAVHAVPPGLPVTVYTGGRSHPGLQRIAHRLVQLIPGARLVELPESGHDLPRRGAELAALLLAQPEQGPA